MSDARYHIDTDGSLIVTATTLEGKVLSVRYALEDVRAILEERGLRLVKHSQPVEAHFVEVDVDELSPEARAEVAEHAVLDDWNADRDEMEALDDRWDVLMTQRMLDRNGDRIDDDAIDRELCWLRDRMTTLRSLIGIARADEEQDMT